MEFLNKYYRKVRENTDKAITGVEELVGISNEYHGSSIKEFKSKLGTGLFKPTNYLIEFEFPRFIQQRYSPKELSDLGHLVETTDLPQKMLTFAVNRVNGKSRKTPYQYDYTEFPCTFIETEDHRARNIFEQWMNAVVDPVTNYSNFEDDIIGGAKIKLLDSNGLTVKNIELRRLLPYTINNTALSYNQKNDYGRTTVVFLYLYYVDDKYDRNQMLNTIQRNMQMYEDYGLEQFDKLISGELSTDTQKDLYNSAKKIGKSLITGKTKNILY